MDKYRDTGVQTTPDDDDDVFDISPTSTLHRGSSLTSPTSPGHPPSIFARVRNSFSSQKVKDLKRQLRQCEDEITRISSQLEITTQENNDVSVRLANIIKVNPFNVYINGACRNVQVGGSNTVVHNPSTETVVSDLEELTGKLTAAVQENTQERTNTEMKLKNAEVLLKEMKDSLQLCTSMIGKLDKSTCNKLGHVTKLLESLTSDRSDDCVIKDGVGRLRQYIDRNRIVRVADELPLDIQVAVTRMVNKFGHLTWQEFAEILEIKESSIQARGRNENTRDAKQTTFLDRDLCARILAQWVTKSPDNNADKLLNIVQDFEAQKSREMTETFRKKTVGQSVMSTVALPNEQNQRSSMTYSDTSTGSSQSWGMRRAPSQQLPDHRSQFEHQLEAWKLQVEMNTKLDKMLTLMTEEKKSVKGRDTKQKLDDVLYRKVVDEGQFV